MTDLERIQSLRRSIHRAQIYWEMTKTLSPVGVSRIHGSPLVGDLPPRAFALIAAHVETGDIARQIGRLR